MNPKDSRTVELSDVLEFSGVREILRGYLTGPLAVSQLEELSPLTDLDAIRKRLGLVGEAVAYLRENSRPGLGRLDDPKPQFAKLCVQGVSLEPRELLQLKALARMSHESRRLFDVREFPRLSARTGSLPDFRPLVAEVEKKILPDGSIPSSASPQLKKIRQQVERVGKKIEKALQSFLEARRKDSTLQDEVISIHNDRFVVPIKSGGKRRIAGIVHGASSSGASVFVEPMETVGLNNERVELQEKEAAEIRRLLAELTEGFRERSAELEQAADVLAELDLVLAKAQFARDYDCCLPEFGTERVMEFKNARHPLLEKSFRSQGKKSVPMSFKLGAPATVMVISGPNSGGKTVILKTVGLAALMAQAGVPVPAEKVRLPVFRQVRVDIGDQQSIEQSLSTFSGHVANIQAMISDADARDLILLDEIGSSTDAAEGAALAIAILDYFRKAGALTLVTTHHTRLKAYAAETPQAVNAGMEFDEETLRPTYHLLMGIPGKSSGIDISARLGLEASVVEQARGLISAGETDVAQLLESLHVSREQLEKGREEMERERHALSEREKALKEEFEQEKRGRLTALEGQLEAALRGYEKNFQQAAEALTAGAEAAKLKETARRKAASLKREARSEWNRQVEDGVGATESPLPPGDRVRPRVGDRVRIGSIPTPGRVTAFVGEDQAEVEVGRMRMRVDLEDIRGVLRESRAVEDVSPYREREASFSTDVESSPDLPDSSGPELHVRGLRVDEACDRVDKFLDQSVVEGHSQVRVVHGKGTGTLKKALSEMFTGHPHVAAFRMAEPRHGGDGVTVVTLHSGV